MLRSFWFVRPRDYYTKESAGVIDWQRNGEPLDGDGCFTTQITEDAVRLFGLHLIGSQFVRFPNTGAWGNFVFAMRQRRGRFVL